MIKSPVLPFCLGESIYRWVPRENKNIIIKYPIARKCYWSSGVNSDMFKVPIQLNIYIYNYPEKKPNTLKKLNDYELNQLFTHPFTLSASRCHHYSHKDKWKELLATNKEKNPNLTPHFVGYDGVLKWPQ